MLLTRNSKGHQSRGFCVNSLLLFWAAIQTCRLYFRWWDRDMENAAIKLKGMACDEVYTAVLRRLRLSCLMVPRDTFTSSRRRFMEVSTIFINRHASLCVRSVICRRRWLSVSQSALCDENWCQTLTFHLYFFKKPRYRRRTARRAMSVKISLTVETCCTTSTQQIAVIELEVYSWSTCCERPRLVDCRIGVVNEFDRRRRRRRRRVFLHRDAMHPRY